MNKSFTHLRLSAPPADAYLSQRIHTGPSPHDVSGSVNDAAIDEFVNVGAGDEAIEWKIGGCRRDVDYTIRLSPGARMIVPVGNDGRVEPTSVQLFGSDEGILCGGVGSDSTIVSLIPEQVVQVAGHTIKYVSGTDFELIPHGECNYKVAGDWKLGVTRKAIVPEARPENVTLQAGQVYLLRGRFMYEQYKMLIDLDPSFQEWEHTVAHSYADPYYSPENGRGGSTPHCTFFRSDFVSIMVLPRKDVRCRLTDVDVQKLSRVRMRNWSALPTKTFYPVDFKPSLVKGVPLRISQAALRRGRVLQWEMFELPPRREMNWKEMRFIIVNPRRKVVKYWPVWAPLPEGFRRDYRLTAVGDRYYVTRPWEQVSSSPRVSLGTVDDIPGFNRSAVMGGIVKEAMCETKTPVDVKLHHRTYYFEVGIPQKAHLWRPGSYALLERIMEYLGLKDAFVAVAYIEKQFDDANLTSAQVESVRNAADKLIGGANQLSFKFHLEIPDDQRLLFLSSFSREFFSDQSLISKTVAFKLWHSDRVVAGLPHVQPLLVFYPRLGIKTFFDVARRLRTIVERLDFPSSGAVPRFSIPIEPTNRLFMVHGGGDLKLALEKKGLLDVFFDSGKNHALPHVVTRDPSNPIMQFLKP